MTTKDVVMLIKKPKFTVKLHPNLLEVDLNEGLRKKLEEVLEAEPTIRDSLGMLFQFVVPIDIPLKDIESATADDKGQVKIAIPHRRDIHIPLEPAESNQLVAKLNELIPIEKAKEVERILESEKIKREREPQKAWAEFTAEEEGRMPR
jgi:hypothetical protein